MASPNSRINNGEDQLEAEEEEEYEEIEEEIEVEEEVEVEEEEEEEEFEEVEEEVEEEEEEEEEPEVEDEEEEEEEEEAVEKDEPEKNEEEVDEDVVEEEDEEEYEEVEEEEYEEVEVEEEVTDVEEEEEDATMADAECDDKRIEQISDAAVTCAKLDLPSISQIPDNVCQDASQHVEPEGDEVCLSSGYSSVVKTEANIHGVEVFCTDEGKLSPELQNGDRKSISSMDMESSKTPKLLEHSTGPQSDAVNYKESHVELETLVSASEKRVSASDAASDQLGKLDTTGVEESKHRPEEADLHLPSRQSVDYKESRSWFPQVRRRSLSPGAEREDGNKRPAIICDYFAKGWCIKGSSCRFLHKREIATQIGDALPLKSDLLPNKGSGDNYASVVCEGSSSFAGKDIPKEHGEGMNLPEYVNKDETGLLESTVTPSLVFSDSQKSSSCKDGSRSISNPKEEAVGFEKSHSSDNHGLSVAEDGTMLHENFFPWRGSSMWEVGVGSGSGSILRLIEESAAMRRRYSLDVQSPVPSYHLSSWKNTSLLHKSPLSSGSGSEKFSGTSYAQDQLTPFKYKTTFTPYNWEPSVSFQSSYFISPVKKSDIQYDPFRDSIEQPDVARPSFRNSSYSQTQDVHSISGRNSIELHKELQFDNWDKNYSVHDKVAPEVEAESAATSASDAQNKMVEEENPAIPGSVKDILQASRNVNDGNSKVHGDSLRHGELKVEKGRQPNELGDEETKTIKIFRAALVEYVKELMKPIWHEGRLSKDVYKVIVQKAEDKILSTLQSNQVPSSSEAIKQYLYSSRPKMLKLIQAYVDKYGRF